MNRKKRKERKMKQKTCAIYFSLFYFSFSFNQTGLKKIYHPSSFVYSQMLRAEKIKKGLYALSLPESFPKPETPIIFFRNETLDKNSVQSNLANAMLDAFPGINSISMNPNESKLVVNIPDSLWKRYKETEILNFTKSTIEKLTENKVGDNKVQSPAQSQSKITVDSIMEPLIPLKGRQGWVKEVAKKLIDIGIEPYLARDGGSIEVVDVIPDTDEKYKGLHNEMRYNDDPVLVKVRLTGHCATCSHAIETLRGFVEKALRTVLPRATVVRVEDKV